MNLLLLGGVAESRELALDLHGAGHDVTYSVAGLVRLPDLPCRVISGGFSDDRRDGIAGLADYCRTQRIDLLIDATHPYAADISAHAAQASRLAGIPCWRLQRPGWERSRYPNWRDIDSADDLAGVIDRFQRPFWSIGRSAMDHVHLRAPGQTWIVRSARPFEAPEGVIPVVEIGPFDLEHERRLLAAHDIDVMVSKDSGCRRVQAKMDAAAERGIPVFVIKRPRLADVDRVFGENDALRAALETFPGP